MDQIRTVIVSDDREYARAFAGAMNYRSDIFHVNIRSCDEYISEWKKRGQAIRSDSDLILWDGEEGEAVYGGNIVWIRSGEDAPDAGSRERGGRYSLYRYDNASSLHSRLIDIYESLTGRKVMLREDRETRVIAFVSWQGGAGCTTVAKAVGHELTRFYGKKVLVISLDSFGSEAPLDGYDPAFSIDSFLYRLFHREKKTGAELDQFLLKDGYGLWQFAPSLGRNPVPNLSEEDARRFMETLIGEGFFDAVLIDEGDCSTDGGAAMISYADRICSVERKYDEYKRRRSISWVENFLGKSLSIIRVGNRIDDRKNETYDIVLERRPETSEEILLEGGFGDNIHALTELLWYNKNADERMQAVMQ